MNMNDLIAFLTSQEIMFVYLISASACIISLVVYFIRKKSELLRRRHNTKELNKLVEEVRERVPVEETPVNNELVIQSVEEMHPTIEVLDLDGNDEFEYTSIEPDQETARLELQRLKDELKAQEEKERAEELERLEQERLEAERLAKLEAEKEEVINIDAYEDNQEATAIISLDELLEKSRDLYSINELNQYASDNNQPISIQDLEKQMSRSVTKYEEPFVIENVVVDDDEVVEEVNEEPVIIETHEVVEPVHSKFKATPIISPIFGIERTPSEDNSLALENTANYEKLDAQIKKQNEFSMTLKEFQKN